MILLLELLVAGTIAASPGADGEARQKSADSPAKTKRVDAEKSKSSNVVFFMPRGQTPGKAESTDSGSAKGEEPAHPIDPALDLIRQCQATLEAVQDYSAVFVKQELLGNQLGPETYVEAKFRRDPYSVYFKWVHPKVGKEAIYVEGSNDNQILTHGTGLAQKLRGTMLVDPDSRSARVNSRHSIRDHGLENLVKKLIARWEFERRFDESEVRITSATINERRCRLIAVVHPNPDDGKFMFHTMKVYVDEELMLPVRAECYGYPKEPGREPGRLLESHTYLNIELNPGFTDIDFSTANPEYSFSRF